MELPLPPKPPRLVSETREAGMETACMASRRRSIIVLAGLAAAALTSACGSATDRIRGGEARFDAAEPQATDAAGTDAAPGAEAAAPDAASNAARDAATD